MADIHNRAVLQPPELQQNKRSRQPWYRIWPNVTGANFPTCMFVSCVIGILTTTPTGAIRRGRCDARRRKPTSRSWSQPTEFSEAQQIACRRCQCHLTLGHLKNCFRCQSRTARGVNVNESERERNGIIRRQFCGASGNERLFFEVPIILARKFCSPVSSFTHWPQRRYERAGYQRGPFWYRGARGGELTSGGHLRRRNRHSASANAAAVAAVGTMQTKSNRPGFMSSSCRSSC